MEGEKKKSKVKVSQNPWLFQYVLSGSLQVQFSTQYIVSYVSVLTLVSLGNISGLKRDKELQVACSRIKL